VAAGWGFEPQISTFIPDERINAVKFLVEEVGLNINQRDDKGYTPLHGAALMSNNDLIRYMVAMGADVKARANSAFGPGDTAVSIAVAAGMGDSVADMANGPRSHNLVHPETLELLVSLGSINSDNCRASTCVIKERSDKKPNNK
jgi:ankyrin repeat protein